MRGRTGATLVRIAGVIPLRKPQPAGPRAFAEAIAAALSGSASAAAASASW